MWKNLLAGLLSTCTIGVVQAANLTPLEQRWLDGIAPVLAFARATKFPVDIVVQPQPTPGLTPMGMAFVDGRCKLVLSMRGNPLAQTALDGLDAALANAALELMAAHELGHCERHLEGHFAQAPAGFDMPDEAAAQPARNPAVRLDRLTARREEGYADLVGLAWTQHRNPGLYEPLYAWLLARRSAGDVRGSEHDTTPWLRLVSDGKVLADPSIFSHARALWLRALPGVD